MKGVLPLPTPHENKRIHSKLSSDVQEGPPPPTPTKIMKTVLSCHPVCKKARTKGAGVRSGSQGVLSEMLLALRETRRTPI